MDDRGSNRSGMQMGRTLCSFLLSPLGAVAVLSLWGILNHAARTGSNDVEAALSTVAIFTMLSYLATLLVGVPIFLLLRRIHWMSRTACAVGGALGGLIFFSVPYCVWYGISSTVETRRPEMVASTAAGMVAGLLFAQLHRRRRSL